METAACSHAVPKGTLGLGQWALQQNLVEHLPGWRLQ